MIRMTRAAVIETLNTPYVEMALLKGASRRRMVLRHALPNALGPIANAVALSLSYLVGGVIIVETIFNYPGVAKLMVDAVATRDLPLIQSCAMIFCVSYLVADHLADIDRDPLQPEAAPLMTTTLHRLRARRRPASAIRFNWRRPRRPGGHPLLGGDRAVRPLAHALSGRARSSTGTISARSPRKFWLGTDYLGRDIFSRILMGARYTVGISLAAVTLACHRGRRRSAWSRRWPAAGSTRSCRGCSTR